VCCAVGVLKQEGSITVAGKGASSIVVFLEQTKLLLKRLGVCRMCKKKTPTTNDNNDGDGDGEENMIYLQRILCRDAAHLHKKVLPEVVFGELHAAIRAPLSAGKK
jgi:hypothetical protein